MVEGNDINDYSLLFSMKNILRCAWYLDKKKFILKVGSLYTFHLSIYDKYFFNFSYEILYHFLITVLFFMYNTMYNKKLVKFVSI